MMNNGLIINFPYSLTSFFIGQPKPTMMETPNPISQPTMNEESDKPNTLGQPTDIPEYGCGRTFHNTLEIPVHHMDTLNPHNQTPIEGHQAQSPGFIKPTEHPVEERGHSPIKRMNWNRLQNQLPLLSPTRIQCDTHMHKKPKRLQSSRAPKSIPKVDSNSWRPNKQPRDGHSTPDPTLSQLEPNHFATSFAPRINMLAMQTDTSNVLGDENLTGTTDSDNELPSKMQGLTLNQANTQKRMETKTNESMTGTNGVTNHDETSRNEIRNLVKIAEVTKDLSNERPHEEYNGKDTNLADAKTTPPQIDPLRFQNLIPNPDYVRKAFELKDNHQPGRIDMLINDYSIMFDQYQTLSMLKDNGKSGENGIQTKLNQIKREMRRKLTEIDQTYKGIGRYEEESYICIPQFGKEDKVDMKTIDALPTFNPKDIPPTLKEFWQKISQFIETAELTEKAAKLILQFRLQGEAHEVFEMNEEKPVGEIIRNLKESFGGFPTHTDFEEQMNNFRRRNNESLKAAMNRYQFIINQLYKNQEDVHKILELKCKNMVKVIAMKEALERLERAEMRNPETDFKFQDRLRFLSREEDILIKRNDPQVHSFIFDSDEHPSSDEEQESDFELEGEDYEDNQPGFPAINNTNNDFHYNTQEPIDLSEEEREYYDCDAHPSAQEPPYNTLSQENEQLRHQIEQTDEYYESNFGSSEYEDYDPYNTAPYPTVNMLADEYEAIRLQREAEQQLPPRFIEMDDEYYERRQTTYDQPIREEDYQQDSENSQDECENDIDLEDYNGEPISYKMVINSLSMENAQLKRELELREILQPLSTWPRQQAH